jgi:predicted metal-binding protein
MEKIKIGIIICDRYHTCAGGKCFRALHNREGAFEMYKDKEWNLLPLLLVADDQAETLNIHPKKKNGVTHVHFATEFLVGYPPCPYYGTF